MQPLIYDIYVNYLKGQDEFLIRDISKIEKEKLNNYEIVWYNTIMNYLAIYKNVG